jgi:hypothetical protein
MSWRSARSRPGAPLMGELSQEGCIE